MVRPNGEKGDMAVPENEEEIAEQLKALYPCNPTDEICEKLNITMKQLRSMCKKYHILKDKAYLKEHIRQIMKEVYIRDKDTEKGKRFYRKGENMIDKYGERGKEIIEKSTSASYDARKKDEKRWLYGMPLKTNFKFSNRRSAYLKRAYLRKLGYEVAYKSNVAYYNECTRRSERLERDYKCFKFIERQ